MGCGGGGGGGVMGRLGGVTAQVDGGGPSSPHSTHPAHPWGAASKIFLQHCFRHGGDVAGRGGGEGWGVWGRAAGGAGGWCCLEVVCCPCFPELECPVTGPTRPQPPPSLPHSKLPMACDIVWLVGRGPGWGRVLGGGGRVGWVVVVGACQWGPGVCERPVPVALLLPARVCAMFLGPRARRWESLPHGCTRARCYLQPSTQASRCPRVAWQPGRCGVLSTASLPAPPFPPPPLHHHPSPVCILWLLAATLLADFHVAGAAVVLVLGVLPMFQLRNGATPQGPSLAALVILCSPPPHTPRSRLSPVHPALAHVAPRPQPHHPRACVCAVSCLT